jgi:ribosomal protein S18 acetylase RimI-like enzyme
MSTHQEELEAALPSSTQAPKDRSWRAGIWQWLPIRSLSERHRNRVQAHLLELDDHDRHLRFGHVVSDEQIERYVAQLDFDRDEVFGIFDARLRLVANSHLAFAEDHRSAEFGVSVHPRVRGRGIGGRLFEHAVMHARNRGARSMAIHLARENTAMLNIVRRSGATVSLEGGDVMAQLQLPQQTLGSKIEALVESQVADIDYRIKLQVLRLDSLWPGSRAQVPRT